MTKSSSPPYILHYGNDYDARMERGFDFVFNHLVDNKDAMVMVFVPMGSPRVESKAWKFVKKVMIPKLETYLFALGIAPPFTDGPKVTLDKSLSLFVKNRLDGWSRLILATTPRQGGMGDRMLGIEPSFIFVDEAQDLSNSDYLALVRQIGRRPGIDDQKVWLSAGPIDKDHWLAAWFFSEDTARYLVMGSNP